VYLLSRNKRKSSLFLSFRLKRYDESDGFAGKDEVTRAERGELVIDWYEVV